MRKREKEALLIAFLHKKLQYERLGEYITRLIRDDPSAPNHNFHTIIYRIKDEKRFIEKVEKENKTPEGILSPVTVKNFPDRIGDLLGMRLICLRLADINIIEAYFQFLMEEKVFHFIKKPKKKQSFILPMDKGGRTKDSQPPMYSGYSSIHYQIMLGEGLPAPSELKGLQVEFQLRTILEEAWGEIDHKYRYAYSRSGADLPEYIHSGFYNLSAYLQAAAMQAENLCRQVELQGKLNLPPTMKKRKEVSTQGENEGNIAKSKGNGDEDLLGAAEGLKDVFGFRPTERTLIYILKRFRALGCSSPCNTVLPEIVSTPRLHTFTTVFREIVGRDAFQDTAKRNVDVVNAINFMLVEETQGARVALEGLRAVLKHRKESSEW
jgi:putative GTP pyrophosphokinase